MTTQQAPSPLPPGEETPAFSRKLNSKTRACITCHQRKVRCDILTKGSPCTNCVAQDRPSCHIYQNKKLQTVQARSARRARRIIAIQPRSHQTQQLFQAVSASQDDTDRSQWATDTPSHQVPEDTSSCLGAQELPKEQQDSRRDDRGPAAQSAASDDRDQLNEQSTKNLADFLDNSVEKAGEIDTNHRVHFIGNDFSNLNYLVRRRASPINHNQLHFGSHLSLPRVSSVPSEALKLPDKSLVDELIQVYFSRVNPGWPIVDEEDFMNRYRSADPKRPVSILLLHAILLVGAHVSASRHKEYKSLQACFFRRAKMLIDARFEEDRKVYIQAALLMTWNCDQLEDVVSNSWYWVGFAARTALGLGMHRDPSQSRMSAVTRREWIRLWWVLFQFDVLVSVAHGRPQAIRRLDESDTPPLQQCHFEGIPSARVAFVVAHTNLCIILSKSMRQILQLKSTPAESTDAIRQAGESLGQFITQLPDCLRLPQPQADTWQSFLQLTYNNFLILLHRPPAQTDASLCLADTSGHSSICADAISVITSTFEFIGARGMFGELALPSVYTLFTSLVYVSGEIASPNPLVVAKAKRMLDSLLNSLRQLSHHYIYPRSILRVFEGQAVWERQRRNQCHGPDQAFDAGHEQEHQTEIINGDSLDLFLRDCLLDISPSTDFGPENGPDNMFLFSNHTSLFTAVDNTGADRTLSPEAIARDTSHEEHHREGSIECELMADNPGTIP